MPNLAAVLPAEKAQLTIQPYNGDFSLAPTKVLITNRSISINPFEVKLQRHAIYPLHYPAVLGVSFAGTIEEIGSSITSLKAGDRVAAAQPFTALAGKEGKYKVWQQHVVADERYIAKLPDDGGVSFEAAAGTVSNLMTVIAAFSLVMGMGRIAPGATPSAGKKILVYGGSSAVGGLAVQVATRLGAAVVTTSSRRNWEDVKERCKGVIVDHTLETHALKEKLLKEGPYDYVFDTIGGAEVTTLLGGVLAKQGGGVIYSTFVTREEWAVPEGVERKAFSYPGILQADEELYAWFNAMFGPALEQGRILPTKTEKVEGGLDAVQSCLDRIADGKVSGVKLVVDPSKRACDTVRDW